MRKSILMQGMFALAASSIMSAPGQPLPKRLGKRDDDDLQLPRRNRLQFNLSDRIAKFFNHLNQLNADRAKLNNNFNSYVFTKQVAVFAINQKVAQKRLEWLLREYGLTAEMLSQIEQKMAEEVKQITDKHSG